MKTQMTSPAARQDCQTIDSVLHMICAPMLGPCLWLASIGGPVAIILSLMKETKGPVSLLHPGLAGLALVQALVIYAAIHRDAPPWIRGGAGWAYFTFFASLVLMGRGITMSASVMLCFGVLIAGITAGLRALVGSYILMILLVTLTGYGWRHGVFPLRGSSFEQYSPQSMIYWFRGTLYSALLIGLICYILVFLARRMVVLVRAERAASMELAEKERRWATLVENLPGVAYRCRNDDAFTVEFISDGCLHLFGHTAAEFKESRVTLLDIIPPGDREHIREGVRESIRARGYYDFVYQVETMKPQVRWISERGRPVFSEAGEVVALEGFISDITAIKRTGDELRNSEARLSRMFQLSPDSISLSDASTGVFLDTNEGFQRVFGYSRQETIGHSSHELGIWANAEDRQRMMADIGGGGIVQGRLVTMRRKDGVQILVDFSSREIELGDRTCMLSILNDVTERKRLEAEYVSLTRLAPVGIGLLRNRQVVMANESMCHLLARSEEEIRGMSIRDCFLNPEDRDLVVTGMKEVLRSGGHVSHEFRLRRPDKSEIDVHLRLAPLPELPEADTWVALIIDISAQKQAEALRIAKTKADSANQAKSAFLANMSHEIRTPMNAILGFTQLLLREESLTAKQRGYLSIIDNSGEHLLGLINDVLEISKIEAKRVTLNKCSFSPASLISETCSMFSSRTESSPLRLEASGLEHLPPLAYGDKGKLRQVLINLLGNAIRFTAQGLVQIEACSTDQPEGRHRLRIEISDNGPGITTEEQAALFSSFEQTSAGLATGGGTGLGLAISREYARLMEGDVTLQHSSPEGSRFRIEVMLEKEHDQPPTPPTHSQPDRAALHFDPPFTPFRILLADDERNNLLLLTQILDQPGVELSSCTRGEEAVELFATMRPHCVFMDLRMPGMDGQEAIRRLRESENASETRIIAMTASALTETRRTLLAEGANALLCKPFRVGELLDTIHRLYGSSVIGAEVQQLLERKTDKIGPGLREAITSIPQELRPDLSAALMSADQDLCLRLLKPLELASPEAHACLLRHLLNYDYATLITELETLQDPA